MGHLRAALTSLPGIDAEAKAALERRFLERIESAMGGPQAACAAYLEWLQHNGQRGMEVDLLTRLVRWEVAQVNATMHALADCEGDTGVAFFILHVDKDGARARSLSPAPPRTPSRPSSSARLRA